MNIVVSLLAKDAAFLGMVTSKEGNGISSVRSAYLAEEGNLEPNERMQLLAAANQSERLVWLGEAYMALGKPVSM